MGGQALTFVYWASTIDPPIISISDVLTVLITNVLAKLRPLETLYSSYIVLGIPPFPP